MNEVVKGLRVISLQSENVKRISAVTITPNSDVIEIAGDNEMGKTSCLDSLWYAFAGTGNIPTQPIRRGAESARIRLDLGEIIVTRTFKRQGDDKFTTSLRVESADGASYKSPQSMLDALLTSLTFDPLEFTRMKARDQFDALRAFVPDVDFKKIDDQNRGDYERRTEANKRSAEAKAAAGLIFIKSDLPDDEIPEAELVDQIAGAGQRNADIQREAERRERVRRELAAVPVEINRKIAKALELEREAAKIREEAAHLERNLGVDTKSFELLPALEQPIDVTAIRAKLESVQKTNAAIRTAAENRRKKAALEKSARDAALLSDELSAAIKARTKAKEDAIAAAKMPIPGLGFGTDCVTLNGLPFDQASSAQQLKASIGIAMASNSRLHVIRVKDGSLMDNHSFQLLTEMAAEKDYQVWVESVHKHTSSAIIIENGEVKAAESDHVE